MDLDPKVTTEILGGVAVTVFPNVIAEAFSKFGKLKSVAIMGTSDKVKGAVEFLSHDDWKKAVWSSVEILGHYVNLVGVPPKTDPAKRQVLKT